MTPLTKSSSITFKSMHIQIKPWAAQSWVQGISKSVSSKGLKEFINSYYCPSQIIISAAGNIDHTKLVGWLILEACLKNVTNLESPQHIMDHILKNRETLNKFILLGLDGVSYIDNNFFQL